MRALALFVCLALAILGVPGAASAHVTSTGLATVTVSGTTATYRLEVVATELPEAPARLLAAAANGEEASAAQAAAALRRLVTLRVGDIACRPGRATIQGSHLGGGKVTLTLAFQCPAGPGLLRLREDWFDLFGEHYRTLVRLEGHGSVSAMALLPDAREAVLGVGAAPSGLAGFIRLGVEHILTGYDHLLFLAALLLRSGGPLSLLKVVTAFTVAHSVTLSLAVLGLVSVSPRIVEPAIAASIVLVAVQNLRSAEAPRRRWLVAFGLGLVHGLGFASALQELALPRGLLAAALVGFNLGVEAGQVLVVAAALPALLWMRGRAWELRIARAVSVAVALAGTAWLVERLLLA